MSATLNLALQLSAVSIGDAVLTKFGKRIDALGDKAQRVKRDFAQMQQSLAAGAKGIAIAYAGKQMLAPGVRNAATLEASMNKVKMELGGTVKNATELDKKMQTVRKTATSVSANLPFSANDVVAIQTSLLKGGLALNDIAGDSGAAFSTAALAALTGQAPEAIGDSIARIGAQFNLQGGQQYTEAADWLLRASSSATTDVGKIIYGLRMSGSAADGLNINLQDSITSLAMLGSLGEQAGSSYMGFLRGVKGNTPEAIRIMNQLGLSFFDDGQFVGMNDAITRLRAAVGGIADDQKRAQVLAKLFGDEGGRAANTFVNAKRTFADLTDNAKGQLGLNDRIGIWADGLNAAINKLQGTLQSTSATLFDPLLAVLTDITNAANTATGALGELLEDNSGLANVLSYSATGAVMAAGGWGAYKMAQGALYGGRALKGYKGLGSGLVGTATGIAKGKAIEAATGVTPVYVTNMSDMPVGGMSLQPGVAGINATTASKGAGKFATASKWAGRLAMPAMMFGGALTVYDQYQQSGMGRDTTNTIVNEASGAGAAWAGGKIGALIGTAIMPGVGTLIGGALGGLGGYIAGSNLADTIFDAVAPESKQAQKQEVGGEIVLKVDSSLPTSVQSITAVGGIGLTAETDALGTIMPHIPGA